MRPQDSGQHTDTLKDVGLMHEVLLDEVLPLEHPCSHKIALVGGTIRSSAQTLQ
jgi:hypothetical protein